MTELERIQHTTELKRIQRIVAELDVPKDHLLVSGSGAMVLHGIDRSLGDLDIYLATSDWFDIARGPDDWMVYVPNPEDARRRCDPPFLFRTMHGIEVNIFFAWRMRRDGLREINTGWWVANPELRHGVPTVPLLTLRRWKRAAGRPKDLADVRLIEDHLAA